MPDAGEIMQEGVFGFGISILGLGVWFFSFEDGISGFGVWIFSFEDGISGFGVWIFELEKGWVALVAFVGLVRFRPLKGW